MLNKFQFKMQFRIFGLIVLLIQTGCEKFVQIPPSTTQITGSTVYSTNTSAAAVMTGLYFNMINGPALSSGNQSIGYYMGLAADELTNYNPNNITQVQFYENALSSYSNNNSNFY